MTQEEKELLEQVRTRIQQLVLQDQRLKSRNASLQQQLQQRDERICNLESELKQVKVSYANLKIAKTMELTEEDTRAAHRRLTNLVRQVDECIALLKS
ncbi:MAG: hypothetical protein K2F69_01495 [Bacteroidaceae bacterium]|nr:hypothetical protein [Bacteroidaceae bacterium]MDE6158768.1 hypothetical protein [Bacteroidaceae bacterium]